MKKMAILALLSVICLEALSLRYGPIDAGLAAKPVTTPNHFVYLPFVAKNWPAATPIPHILYEGLTDQGRPISLEVESDFSAVRKITISFHFSCGGMTRDVTSVSLAPTPIQGGSFATEFLYMAVTGRFDALSPRKQSESNLCPKEGDNASAADFNSVEGTWQGIMPAPWQPGEELCRGPVGRWNASRQ